MKITIPDLSPFSKADAKPFFQSGENFLETCLKGEECYSGSLGWLDIDKWAGDVSLKIIEKLAENIRKRDEVFVLIGVGGSNNAARSVIEAIGDKSGTKVVYAGNNLSPYMMNQVLEQIRGKNFSINVIAKNFETLEPGLAFRVLRQELVKRYGEAANERIIATGTYGSLLENICNEKGYTFIPFPTDIGGRYTALSNVGLLPMAVAGIDIRELVNGAKKMRSQLESEKSCDNIAVKYAAVRNLLYVEGYRMELFASFEPRLKWFNKWWVQLFGESDGKDNKGIFPSSAEYSEDLHSIGQFVQDGTPVLFETLIDFEEDTDSFVIKKDSISDKFDYVNDVDLAQINLAAQEATVHAHSQVLPVLRITLDKLCAAEYGKLFYFFQFACYLSGKVQGSNPFDQPGVEAYKMQMFERLGK